MSDAILCPLCGSTMTLRTARYGPRAGSEFWGCSRFPACKGLRNIDGSAPPPPAERPRPGSKPSSKSAATVAPKPRVESRPHVSAATATMKTAATGRSTKLSRGDLLVFPPNQLGPGKLVATDGDGLVLEYFDTPGQEPQERTRETVPRRGLQRFDLKPETRVFWESDGRWRSGRIIESNEHRDVHVRARDWEGFVPEDRLYVRWNQPLADPVGFAEGRQLESPLLADLRRPFLRAILRQRSAARGMRGALSSAIELHDHQLETAWRVLQDPIQRYLLADEVGLGKTIEAGMIVRQLLLEDPQLEVQLVLPPFLIGQWGRELETKFFIKDFPDAEFRFARDDDPKAWSPADLLIVDEAHNLAALATSADRGLADRYSNLAAVATKTPRLLLLSATPALNNEPVFLQMLKLLDPAIYSHVTVDQLRTRLVARAGLGRTFLGLQPGLPRVLLRNRFAEIRTELSSDPEVQRLLDEASSALDSDDRTALTTVIDGLRTHVGEVHRVHRRMLRTRRTSALERSYQVTGRQSPATLAINSGILAEVTGLLEAWRQEVLAAHEDDPQALREAGRAFAEAVSLSFDPADLTLWARSRRAATQGERAALDRLVQDLAFRNRRKDVARPIADALTYQILPKQKVVIFCPTPGLVTDLVKELTRYVDAALVFAHRRSDEPDDVEAAVRGFEEARGTALLVADSSAEEGRNFQFADLLVHVGVPASASRLEQRIGRCDRWQLQDSPSKWRSLQVVEPGFEETFTGKWNRILDDGFNVFASSIASLQFAVETASDFTWQALLAEGSGAASRIAAKVKTTLEAEISQVREQDALDSIEAGSLQRSANSPLHVFETHEVEFGELTHALLAANYTPGNLRFKVVGEPRLAVGGYDPLNRLPGGQLEIPLVSVDRLKRDFLPIRAQRGTFVRATAVQTAGAHLFRYGDQFIDAVSDFLWHDDRGRAFGMWRWVPSWARGNLVAYRFDYAVEARPVHTGSTATVAASLAHRSDGVFPPLIVTIWIDLDGRRIQDPRLLAPLEAPYIKAEGRLTSGDFALNRSRISAAYKFVPLEEWSRTWRWAERTAADLVLSLPEVVAASTNGLSTVQVDSAKRVRQLQLRASRAVGTERLALEREAKDEQVTGASLEAAMRAPTLRLDSTGIVIVSADSLTLGAEA